MTHGIPTEFNVIAGRNIVADAKVEDLIDEKQIFSSYLAAEIFSAVGIVKTTMKN